MKFLNPHEAEDEHWAPMSDLMAVLMLIFMLIAMLYVRQQAQAALDSSLAVAQAEEAERANYREQCNMLYRELQSTVEEYPSNWRIRLQRDLTIQFTNPEVLFGKGKSDFPARFQLILDEFLPDLTRIVVQYQDDVRRVRIEGHTSSEFRDAKSPSEAYIKNMELSQARTRAILNHWLEIEKDKWESGWIVQHITANGLSSSRLARDYFGNEDKVQSRRVEFKIESESCQRSGGFNADEDRRQQGHGRASGGAEEARRDA